VDLTITPDSPAPPTDEEVRKQQLFEALPCLDPGQWLNDAVNSSLIQHVFAFLFI
jgi:hypothetical protein